MIDKELDIEIVNTCNCAQRSTRKYVTDHGYFDYMCQRFDDLSIKDKESKLYLPEILYRLKYGIEQNPICKICGKSIIFNRGYATYCSSKCLNSDPDILKKNAEHVSRSLKKAYAERKDSICAKRSKSLQEKYGIDTSLTSPFAVKSVQDKVKDTITSKYGVDNVFRLDSFRHNEKSADSRREKWKEVWKSRGLDLDYDVENDTVTIYNYCPIHGDCTLSHSDFLNRVKEDRGMHLCLKCDPLYSYSGFENEIKRFLDENNVEYVPNDRKTISPLELDINVPSKHIAIECNGVYYHNEFNKERNYHSNKSDICESKGIQLIHIWEDDYIHNKDIVMSVLRSKLGLITDRIYARKCDIREVSSNDAHIFLDKSHLQGNVNASIRLGLYYNDELVSLMTFGKLRKCLGTKSKDNEYELYRFCNKLNVNVIGGASKLFKHFIEEYHPNVVISYANRDISNGNLYEKLGMTLDKKCGPNYFWVIKDKRENRFKFRKDLISDETNRDKTEVEIMHSKGAYRCYNSGNLKYVLNK